jgi:Putative peptidoglycan binding domain
MRQQPPSGIDDEGRDDDWLAEQGELDWFHDPRHEAGEAEWPEAEGARATGLVRSPRAAERPGPETVVRRRRIAVFAALAVAVLVVIIVIVATSGGSGNSPNVAATTTQPTQPTTSPRTTTTTPTTTNPSSLRVTIPAGGNLSIGDSGPQVVALQKALKALGFYDGTADGDFGSGTEAAVIAFQNAHNLNQDGIVGTDTARALNQALAAAGR